MAAAAATCGKIIGALLAMLLSILLAKLSSYEGRSNTPAPPEAIPIWKKSDLTIFNRIIEYMFPLIAPVGSMVKCPVADDSIDLQCMEKARSAIKGGSVGPWQTMLDAGNHRETLIVIDDGKEGSNGRPPLEVVLVQPINATASELAHLPLIVWLHGGGFVTGAARDSYMLGLMQGLAEKGNIPYDKVVWASIEYPLAPEYKYPAAPNACLRAIQYLTREHQLIDDNAAGGASVHLGGGGLHIGGASAGATLSLLAGQKAMQDGIRVDSLLLDTLVLPISQSRDSSPSVFDSPSYRRNFYTRVPPVDWSNWFVAALTGCETTDASKSQQCRQDVFAGNTLSAEHWQQLTDLPPAVVVTDTGCTFRDTALPFIQMYKSIAGEDKIRHIESKSSHSLHLLFDSDSSEQIAKLWGGLISSRSCNFGPNPSFVK